MYMSVSAGMSRTGWHNSRRHHHHHRWVGLKTQLNFMQVQWRKLFNTTLNKTHTHQSFLTSKTWTNSSLCFAALFFFCSMYHITFTSSYPHSLTHTYTHQIHIFRCIVLKLGNLQPMLQSYQSYGWQPNGMHYSALTHARFFVFYFYFKFLMFAIRVGNFS